MLIYDVFNDILTFNAEKTKVSEKMRHCRHCVTTENRSGNIINKIRKKCAFMQYYLIKTIQSYSFYVYFITALCRN